MLDIFEKYDQIYNAKSKVYFEEVLSSYNNRNYRSTIVMLYSVVIYDIIAKLKELGEIYEQEWANKIIKEINKIRIENPKSPDWEKILIDRISNQRDFLSLSIIEEINHLREIRNQCAHPAIDNNDELFTPTRYEADALLCRMLNEILTIPAMFTGKVTDYITEQISKIAGYSEFKWKDRPQLSKSFIKYFNRMNDKVFEKVFQDMWKLTFWVSNEECDKNRFANMIFLDIMLSERHALLIQAIKDKNEYYNKISSDAEIDRYLSILIYRNNYLLPLMDSTTITFIKNSKSVKEDVQLFAWFAFDSLEDYIDNLSVQKNLHKYSEIIIDNYKNDTRFIRVKEYFKLKIIDIYLNSSTFDYADRNFNEFIYPLQDELTKDNVLYIIQKSEENSQLTRRYDYIKDDLRGKTLLELVNKVGITTDDILNYKHFYKFFTTCDDSKIIDDSNISDDELPF